MWQFLEYSWILNKTEALQFQLPTITFLLSMTLFLYTNTAVCTIKDRILRHSPDIQWKSVLCVCAREEIWRTKVLQHCCVPNKSLCNWKQQRMMPKGRHAEYIRTPNIRLVCPVEKLWNCAQLSGVYLPRSFCWTFEWWKKWTIFFLFLSIFVWWKCKLQHFCYLHKRILQEPKAFSTGMDLANFLSGAWEKMLRCVLFLFSVAETFAPCAGQEATFDACWTLSFFHEPGTEHRITEIGSSARMPAETAAIPRRTTCLYLPGRFWLFWYLAVRCTKVGWKEIAFVFRYIYASRWQWDFLNTSSCTACTEHGVGKSAPSWKCLSADPEFWSVKGNPARKVPKSALPLSQNQPFWGVHELEEDFLGVGPPSGPSYVRYRVNRLANTFLSNEHKW